MSEEIKNYNHVKKRTYNKNIKKADQEILDRQSKPYVYEVFFYDGPIESTAMFSCGEDAVNFISNKKPGQVIWIIDITVDNENEGKFKRNGHSNYILDFKNYVKRKNNPPIPASAKKLIEVPVMELRVEDRVISAIGNPGSISQIDIIENTRLVDEKEIFRYGDSVISIEWDNGKKSSIKFELTDKITYVGKKSNAD